MDVFFAKIKSIIEDLPYNEGLSLQELIDKGDADLKTEWGSRDHATTGREFYNLAFKGTFGTKDFKFLPLPEKNPQRYKKILLDKPIFLEEFNIDISVSLSDVLKILKLMDKTLAIVPINRATTPVEF
jgi:hypothetical protein